MTAALRIKPGLKQRRGISLQLKQALNILSMNHIELEEYIKEQLESNPFLEEENDSGDYIEDNYSQYLSNLSGDQSQTIDSFESYTKSEITLQDYLLNQLHDSYFTDVEKELVTIIISSIDEHGFTGQEHSLIAEKNGFSHRELNGALEIIKKLDPPGIGAKDLWQSLEWQALKKYPQNHLLLDIIITLSSTYEHFPEIDQTTLTELSRQLRIELNDLHQEIKKLSTLNPYPAVNFQGRENRYIYPDIIYQNINNKITVQVTNYLVPELSINQDLTELVQQKKTDEKWIRFYREANHLLQSISYRKDSMLKVGAAILSKQPEFFVRGPDFVMPMGLKDIAETTDLHISTVSRIVSHKYCQTDYGTFPLKVFFRRKLKSAPGENYGIDDLNKAIMEIIQNEDKNSPFSDSDLVLQLEKRGIFVKRRTVAKYRKLLHIPTREKRKVT